MVNTNNVSSNTSSKNSSSAAERQHDAMDDVVAEHERAIRDSLNQDNNNLESQSISDRESVAYEKGYAEGRNQQRIEEEAKQSPGLGSSGIIGLLMAALAGLILTMLYLTYCSHSTPK